MLIDENEHVKTLRTPGTYQVKRPGLLTRNSPVAILVEQIAPVMTNSWGADRGAWYRP
ncbi:MULTISPECIES: hypothetical protein [unclassified Streptomyces]|uniref:hypothetical protein n=1 Tax=unclassified Streptomyces TaxID=2593676 RepID=UPI00225463CD|nr:MULTISPECIES: hypothetical protein [unclassified Streptomyces]MCX5337235.1 hypothetical protein [Streptomyces sp. NBC_00140]MCX5365814.1 hypothetical protein [Streptomyces sp. NBC_00124]